MLIRDTTTAIISGEKFKLDRFSIMEKCVRVKSRLPRWVGMNANGKFIRRIELIQKVVYVKVVRFTRLVH